MAYSGLLHYLVIQWYSLYREVNINSWFFYLPMGGGWGWDGRCFPGIPQQWPIRGVHVASLQTCGFKYIWCVQNVLFGQSELLLSWLVPKPYRHVRFGEFVWCDKVFLAHLKHFLLQMRICHFFKKPWFLLVGKGSFFGPGLLRSQSL